MPVKKHLAPGLLWRQQFSAFARVKTPQPLAEPDCDRRQTSGDEQWSLR